jgi:hypothetical protein
LSSTPGEAGPTVPILIRSPGFDAPAPQVSLIPQISASGTPIAWKKTSTSRGVGAAPTLTSSAWSSPIAARSGANSFSSPIARVAASSAGICSPACSSSTARAAAAISARACSSPASLASRPAFSFSHTRGTAKNQVGLTAGKYAPICRGSGQQVIVMA